jgi:hypothetical protein
MRPHRTFRPTLNFLEERRVPSTMAAPTMPGAVQFNVPTQFAGINPSFSVAVSRPTTGTLTTTAVGNSGISSASLLLSRAIPITSVSPAAIFASHAIPRTSVSSAAIFASHAITSTATVTPSTGATTATATSSSMTTGMTSGSNVFGNATSPAAAITQIITGASTANPNLPMVTIAAGTPATTATTSTSSMTTGVVGGSNVFGNATSPAAAITQIITGANTSGMSGSVVTIAGGTPSIFNL